MITSPLPALSQISWQRVTVSEDDGGGSEDDGGGSEDDGGGSEDDGAVKIKTEVDEEGKQADVMIEADNAQEIDNTITHDLPSFDSTLAAS